MSKGSGLAYILSLLAQDSRENRASEHIMPLATDRSTNFHSFLLSQLLVNELH
jgi:hypothetical protein